MIATLFFGVAVALAIFGVVLHIDSIINEGKVHLDPEWEKFQQAFKGGKK